MRRLLHLISYVPARNWNVWTIFYWQLMLQKDPLTFFSNKIGSSEPFQEVPSYNTLETRWKKYNSRFVFSGVDIHMYPLYPKLSFNCRKMDLAPLLIMLTSSESLQPVVFGQYTNWVTSVSIRTWGFSDGPYSWELMTIANKLNIYTV